MKMKIDELYHELTFEADVTSYVPARPAPRCSNHDSPGYSDSGDDEYCEFKLYIKTAKDGKVVMTKIDDLFPQYVVDAIYDDLQEDVCEKCRDQYEGRRQEG